MPSTMISSNTRASRSRYSSPQQAAPAANEPAKSSAKEEQKTFMQRWLEPQVQSKASFQEAGLMRHGVVENMAPLGTLPKAAASKKHGPAAGQEHTPIRKIILKRPSAAANTPSTPLVPESEEVTPAPTRRSVSSRDVDDDDDYDPKGTSQSTGRPKATRRSLGRPSAHRLSSSSSTLQQTTANSPVRVQDNKETIDKVVEAAVDEALDHFRYPTAWALRTLYDENSSDPHFVSMIEQVYHQTADSETIEEFARLLHEKKKEGKEDNKGCYYFVPPTTNSRFTPHKPKPAPYTDLVTLDVSKFSVEGEVHPRKKVKHSSVHESARKMATNGLNGITNESPSRNRGRAGSVGSDSSLSSAKSVSPPPEGIDEDEEDDVFGVPVGAEGTSSAEPTSNAPGPAGRQPIAARHRSRATTKNNGDVSSTPTPTLDSPSTAHPPTTSAAPGMTAAEATPLFPKLAKNKGKNENAASDVKFPSRFGVIEGDDRRTRLKQFARNITNTRGASSLSSERPPTRERPLTRDPDVDSDFETPARPSSVRPRVSVPPSTVSTRATRSQKRHHDDAEDEASPTSFQFPPDVGVDSGVNSRAVTPLPRPAKRPRTGPRIKTSPMKKKNGPSAGIPRASGERTSPPLGGQPNNQDENDDYCSSCGGNGELVCCDGCTRSFHLTCVDPPVKEGQLPDEWYCHVCFSQRFPTQLTDHRGAFGSLLNNLEKKNSSAFRLPAEVRDYFEGVKTGADGEYEEIVPPAKTKKKGVEEVLDFWKVRDADGHAIICHSCQRSAAKDRAIMPCSLCGLHWHLDCLDPPAANAPVPRTFRCPAHVDDLLARVPGALGPAHRFRKIKGASAIKPAYSRGLINNGYIDVDGEDLSGDESGWKEVQTFGRTYRLPSKGIKLDFFSRARELSQTKSQTSGSHTQNAVPAAPRGPVSVPVDQTEIERQQAALNMATFSNGDQPVISTLINALLDNAEPAVISMMARGSGDRLATSLGAMDRQSLAAMMEQLQAMQERLKEKLSLPAATVDASGSIQETNVNGSLDVANPLGEHDAATTEPRAVTPSAGDRIPTPENSAQSKVEETRNHVSPLAADSAAGVLESGKLTLDAADSPQDPPKVNSDVLTPAATEPDSGMDTTTADEVQEQSRPLDVAMDLD